MSERAARWPPGRLQVSTAKVALVLFLEHFPFVSLDASAERLVQDPHGDLMLFNVVDMDSGQNRYFACPGEVYDRVQEVYEDALDRNWYFTIACIRAPLRGGGETTLILKPVREDELDSKYGIEPLDARALAQAMAGRYMSPPKICQDGWQHVGSAGEIKVWRA